MSCHRIDAIFSKLRQALKPPPILTLSGWADTYRRLPDSAENSGRWKTSYTPYMKEIMDSIGDPRVERIVIKSSAQIGKSELLINTLGFYSHQKPVPILMVQPTIKLAEAFSKERIQPTIDSTPELQEVFGSKKSRSSDNTILQKMFAGGFLCLAGSNAPASLASRAVGVVLLDEVDRYPQNSGGEGDVVSLAIKRTNTFRNRKIIIVSTPTDANTSRIQLAYDNSTQEVYQLQCPECLEHQQIKHDHIVVLEKNGEVPTSVAATCEKCGSISKEFEWKRGNSRWFSKNDHPSTRGFHLNEWVSPWKRWESIEQDYVEAAKDTETLKVWINTSAGEVYEEKGEIIRWDELNTRGYAWDHECPNPVIYITAGVDVQDNSLVYEIVGWSKDGCEYSLEYDHLHGDTNKPEVWRELENILFKTINHESGFELSISAVCIDSGGHATQTVYEFCKRHTSKGIMAIKGRGGWGVPFTSKPKKVKLKRGGQVNLFTLGVDDGKLRVMRKLQNDDDKSLGYCHFPIDRSDDYYKELTAEKLVSRMKLGRPEKKWIPVRRRNEALDCKVYALAALELAKPDLHKIYDTHFGEVKPEPKPEPFTTSKRTRRRRTRKGYLQV